MKPLLGRGGEAGLSGSDSFGRLDVEGLKQGKRKVSAAFVRKGAKKGAFRRVQEAGNGTSGQTGTGWKRHMGKGGVWNSYEGVGFEEHAFEEQQT